MGLIWSDGDIFLHDLIKENLHTKILGQKIDCLKTIDSTNNECRRRYWEFGRKVRLLHNGLEVAAEAVDLGPKGELLVRLDSGELISVISGEISLKLVQDSLNSFTQIR